MEKEGNVPEEGAAVGAGLDDGGHGPAAVRALDIEGLPGIHVLHQDLGGEGGEGGREGGGV